MPDKNSQHLKLLKQKRRSPELSSALLSTPQGVEMGTGPEMSKKQGEEEGRMDSGGGG